MSIEKNTEMGLNLFLISLYSVCLQVDIRAETASLENASAIMLSATAALTGASAVENVNWA